MTDLKTLLKPDQGQPAIPLQLVDKKGFDAWLKAQPARARQAAEAQGFKGEGFQLAILPGERDEWSAALGVANVDELEPLVPRQGGGEPARGQLSRRRARAGAGHARLAARPVSLRPLSPGQEEPPARASSSPTSRRGSTRPSSSPNRPSSSATSSTPPPAISAPPSSRRRREALAEECGAKVSVTAGKALEQGYPMVAAVGARPPRGPRAAADRAGAWRPPPSPARHRRQGRLLRFRRPRPQAGERACG